MGESVPQRDGLDLVHAAHKKLRQPATAIFAAQFNVDKYASLSVEHRAAPSMPPITIELAQRGTALALEVVDRRDPATPPPSSLDERITATLAGADATLPFAELRACCRVRATTLYERLAVLAETGRVVKTDDGYRLADG